jgi:hypothetical protein
MAEVFFKDFSFGCCYTLSHVFLEEGLLGEKAIAFQNDFSKK